MAERGRMNMGYRGPIPKPSAIARAEGNPGKRRLNDSEPQPRATVPRCPAHLDAQAKKEWKRLVPVLRRMRVLTEADWMTLANLCQTWSTLVKAQEKLTEMGILYKTPSGYVQQSPLLSVVNQCVDTITKLSREFGLTPAARSRIMVQTELEPEDDLMAILRMPRPARDRGEPEGKPQ
jgi:P27 family predicted phage terminase small subunit